LTVLKADTDSQADLHVKIVHAIYIKGVVRSSSKDDKRTP